MWHCDVLASCPGCSPAFIPRQLGWAPAPPRPWVQEKAVIENGWTVGKAFLKWRKRPSLGGYKSVWYHCLSVYQPPSAQADARPWPLAWIWDTASNSLPPLGPGLTPFSAYWKKEKKTDKNKIHTFNLDRVGADQSSCLQIKNERMHFW